MLKFLGDKNSYVGATLIFASFLLSTLLFSLVNVSNVFAYTASLSTSGTVTANVTPNTEGDKSIDINQDSVNVMTDCRAGYNLTISSSVTDRNLYKDGNSANNTSGQYFTPVNGTAQLNNTTNQYGYSLTANTESGVFTPLPLPSAPTFIKTTSQTASESDINDNIPVYYGTSTANNLTPGLYKMPNNGYILYQLTLDESCVGYSVLFNPNGGTGTMSNQNIREDETTNLKTNSFTAPAMGQSYQDADGNTIPAIADKMWTFWGWNTEVDGTGDWYKDRESVTNLTNDGDAITLYAQWKQATLADLTASTPGQNKTIDHNTMQDMSSATCWNSDKFSAIGTPYGQATLIDTRDGNTRTYTVARLPDGYCWMTQNLNLGTSTPITLTSNDTDLEEGTTFTLPASDPTDFSTSTDSTNINKATVLNDMTIPDYTVNGTTYSGKVTGYYSYAAATANTSTYSTSSSTEIFNNSICPKNWNLPTNTQYYDLRTKGSITTYNNTTVGYEGKNAGNEPYYFIYGGYRKAAGDVVNTTYFTDPTTYGYLWVANNFNANYGRDTYIYSSGLYNSSAATTSYKYRGLSIRCVSDMSDIETKVTFVNTDTGETQTQVIGVIGESNTITLQQHPTTWTKSGYGLAGWDTNSAGTNIVYDKGETATFSSSITLYTVWKPAYNIQYDGNGADAGVMTNVKHINTYENDIFDLFASNYSKAGYGFAGWSFDPNAQPGGSSRIYGPNEAITAPAGTGGETKTLYAIWVQSAGNLQDWNGCASMSIGDVTALKDTRDNQVYTVGKLADDNCWMMENLRLDTAYSSDSTKSQGFGGVFVGLANSEYIWDITSGTTQNSLYTADTTSTTHNIITGGNLYYRFPRYHSNGGGTPNPNTTDDRATATSAYSTILSYSVYSFGNHYNWPAAKANTEDLTSATTSNAAGTSICPSGWKLPYGNYTGNGNTSGGFYYLGTQLNATASNEASSRIWRSYPNNYIFPGVIAGTNGGFGQYGYYWSATVYNSSKAFEFYISHGSVTAKTSDSDKYYAASIRCVMANGLETKLMLNDGTGRVGGRVYGEANSIVVLPTNLTRKGYRFASWNTAANGSGTSYTNSYTLGSTGVTLYAQWTPTYTLQYDGNGADAGVMTNVKHTNIQEGDVFDLFASNYSKAGYGFAGWSFDPNAQPGGTSRIYGPNEAITAPAGTAGETKTLYAVWVQSAGNLQDWQGCSSMSIGDVTALKDTRDNQVYTVGKLADDNCWMMENLRLDTAGSSDSTKSQGFGGVFVGLADPESANFSNSTTANTLNGNTLYSTANITDSNQGYRFPRYNNSNTGARATSPSVDDDRSTTTSAHNKSLSVATYSYSNYYTWAAALANTNDYTSNTAIVDGSTSETAGTSICPKGWKLPYGKSSGNGNASGGFYYLSSELGTTTNDTTSSRIWRSYPNNFIYSGYYSDSSTSYRGQYGYYWTSSATSASIAYTLYLSSTNIYSGTYTSNSNKYQGRSVRCVMSPDLNTVTLSKNGGTGGSDMTTVVRNATTLGAITNPTKTNTTYTLSGFSKTASATNSNVSSTDSKTSTQTYTFDGWYKEAAATNKIASNATTPVLQANTDYTDASGRWTHDGAVTLYAGWTANGYSSVTLPTITRTGSTCGWATSSTATTWEYASGASIVPDGNKTLYGVCRNNITLNGNGATTAGSTSATVNYNATSLSTITLPQRKYTLSGFSLPSSNNASGATVSSTATKTSTYTFDGWYKESAATNKVAGNTTTPALEPSTTYTNASSQWTYTTASSITLYAGWTGGSITLPTITKSGYTCGWTETATNATFVQYVSGATITPDTDKTLYGVCVTALTVNFNGNSLEFSDGTTTNTMLYHNDCGTKYVSAPEYSHTSNVNDDGTQIGTTVYNNNLATKDVITVPNADSLHVTITYATETNYDYLYVFQGEYTGSVTKNMSAGQLATYNGKSSNVTTTVTLDIPGDTATFAFFSDTSQAYYGYHAKVEGYYNTQPASYDHTTEACVKTLAGGEYKVPVDTPHKKFTGWSESSTATTPTYTSAEDIRQNLSGGNGETKTLYAVWDNYYVITFVNTDTGATSTKQVKYGASGTITSPTTWSNTNYSLAGWDTNSAGTNVVYTKGQSITPTSDITVYTVWKPSYTIQYDGNGADAGVMTNVKHTNVYENDVFDLFASNYSKTNYGFAGWSFDSSAQPGGSSTIYGPNEAITAPAPSNPGQAETKTLYAVWVQSAGNLQDWNGCASMSIGDVTALKDTRDNQVYTVGKLADDNCWMMENLRLDTANSSDSTKAQGFGTGFVGLADPETANFSNSTTANTLNGNTLYSTTNITGSNQGYRFPRYYNTNTSARSTNPSATDNRSTATSAHASVLNAAIYSYGNYYTWAAAKANIEDLTTKDASEAANTSLCPSGWKLPYGGSSGKGNDSGGFYYLGTQLGATASNETSSRIWRSYPNNSIYAGYYFSTSATNRGADMNVWSASTYSSTSSYFRYISAKSSTISNSNKYNGNSVRCVAEQVGAILDTGQNVNQKLKRLAGNSSATYSTQNTTITAFVRSNTLPNNFTPTAENTISDSSSPYPIYAWYDSANTTIYYYSKVTDILMNQDSSYFFYQMKALSNLSTISTWDTSSVVNMSYMFFSAGSASFTLDLSSWDTSSVTNMNQMFVYSGSNATTWSIGDVSNWDTSSVTNMHGTFAVSGQNATTWFAGDLSNWDTSNVTDMYGIFNAAGEKASSFILDLSSWDTSSAINMSAMFASAGENATTWSVGDLSSWNTSSATDMSLMFQHAGYSSTTWSIGDLSSWNTSSATSLRSMFNGAGYSATTWSIGNLSSWNTSNVTDMSLMFRTAGYSAPSFVLNFSGWNTSSVTDMSDMFDLAGYSATTWSVTIPKTNDGTASGPITNTTSRLYGKTTSVYAVPHSGKSFTIVSYNNITNLTYMQNFNELSSSEKTSVLNSMTTNKQYRLRDSRDQKTYYVAKLADGNVWMTQNLDHDIVTTTNFYTPTNTDISSNWTASVATRVTSDTTWSGSFTDLESYDPGDLCWNGTIASDDTGTINNMAGTCTDRHYHIGNYYNWLAAVAGSSALGDPDQSICPAGWMLPKLDSTLPNLIRQQGLTPGASGNIHESPAYYVYGGQWSNSPTGVGGFGYYQVSDADNQQQPMGGMLYFDRTGAIMIGNMPRSAGISARCLAR